VATLNHVAITTNFYVLVVSKRLEEFDYRHQTTITKRQVNQLLDFNFIDERVNLV
jgi:hypothetical protein